MDYCQQIKIFFGTANPTLAREIADFLGLDLGGVRISCKNLIHSLSFFRDQVEVR